MKALTKFGLVFATVICALAVGFRFESHIPLQLNPHVLPLAAGLAGLGLGFGVVWMFNRGRLWTLPMAGMLGLFPLALSIDARYFVSTVLPEFGIYFPDDASRNMGLVVYAVGSVLLLSWVFSTKFFERLRENKQSAAAADSLNRSGGNAGVPPQAMAASGTNNKQVGRDGKLGRDLGARQHGTNSVTPAKSGVRTTQTLQNKLSAGTISYRFLDDGHTVVVEAFGTTKREFKNVVLALCRVSGIKWSNTENLTLQSPQAGGKNSSKTGAVRASSDVEESRISHRRVSGVIATSADYASVNQRLVELLGPSC